jgi:lysine 2,3-aminomutase
LCVSCQRMYEFQSGHLNFNLDKLAPKETWPQKLKKLLTYYEHDAQLRDILITGGDALMSSDKSIKLILDEVYEMALRKKQANTELKNGDKLAEMLRIRLGTRLPVYLPQRITPELISVLSDFRKKASQTGFVQFVIQTHFETAMEITPEVKQGIEALLSAGWIVTNQQVFTAAAARRGHTAKLRKVLNDIGVLTYYTFSVKGFSENKHNFATNARAMQEQIEEKSIGIIPKNYRDYFNETPLDGATMVEKIDALRQKAEIPFLGTDRNVLNMPGVGKSLSFRTIGITPDGRRILEFDHDPNRIHSPVVDQMGKVIIIESKSLAAYMRQLEEMGENTDEYQTLYGYSIGATEKRFPLYSYPDYDFDNTDEMTNFEMELINN